MGLFSSLFGNKNKKIADFAARGAIVLDVRTKAEYGQGAIGGSKNIALQQLASQMSTIAKWNKPIITCCVSGMRSASAAALLKGQGIEALNGGAWHSLQQKL